ncbi:phage protein [Streptococcus pseudopneumoniae]|uniref:Phage protein n=2 Tax=Streptococcus pseudopneumoniae TaxID=257758 RepID=A0A2N9ZZR5_9STRE|nr:YopX family protein [Streptococcus pseudopneumoniae]ETE01123.1 hypothetical protein U753_02275 [Streptococcus pseudopneumoniae 5247]CEY58973.1 phage protein [Streptococcus pseudopneumoniae]
MIPKFRAWDRLRKEMNYKVMVGNCDTDDENWTCPIIWIEEKKDWLHFDDYECIMQSTGLKDKNGKEIFEGDILEIQDEGEVLGNAKLTWDNEQAVFMIEAISVDDIAPFHEILSDESYSYRVVGNVYENKEVLDA